MLCVLLTAGAQKKCRQPPRLPPRTAKTPDVIRPFDSIFSALSRSASAVDAHAQAGAGGGVSFIKP